MMNPSMRDHVSGHCAAALAQEGSASRCFVPRKQKVSGRRRPRFDDGKEVQPARHMAWMGAKASGDLLGMPPTQQQRCQTRDTGPICFLSRVPTRQDHQRSAIAGLEPGGAAIGRRARWAHSTAGTCLHRRVLGRVEDDANEACD